jgi:hypothetical protein
MGRCPVPTTLRALGPATVGQVRVMPPAIGPARQRTGRAGSTVSSA